MIVFAALAAAPVAMAQDGGQIALLIPSLYGARGLTLNNPDHLAHFNSSFQTNFAPFNTALAIQLTSLPLPSPASGFTYSFDPTVGVYTRSAASFGPILAERAETVGKDKFTFGMSYQHFEFNTIDGHSLGKLPAVFTHEVVPAASPNNLKDVITTDNAITASLAQNVAFLTYGISDRIDVSVAVPLMHASLGIASVAKIRRIGSTDPNVHNFGTGGDGTEERFAGRGTASGLGDILVRVKGSVIRNAGFGLALGLDTRMPTGDPYNFLGSGGYGIKPFVAVSGKAGRITPHVNAAFQYNSKSVLAGDIVDGVQGKLPNQFQYVVGAEAGLTKRMTVAGDILGDYFRSDRVFSNPYQYPGGSFPGIRFAKDNLHVINGSLGAKFNPAGRLLVTFNLLFRMNDFGLGSRIVPLAGISYTL